MAIVKLCPQCDSSLVVRTNRNTGEEFWGCVRWPACSHTEPIPLYVKLREQGGLPLPGFE